MLISILAKLFGIGRFRKVILRFEDRSISEHIVYATDLKKFIKAALQLYYSPGKDPNTKEETKKLISITAQPLAAIGHHWWSTPGLRDNPFGAVIWEWLSPEAIWIKPFHRGA